MPLPMPRAFAGVYSPDGRRFAYEEISTAFIPDWYETSKWRHYRGGRTQPVRIMELASNAVEKLPWKNSNDRNAMWVGNTVYFLSDRNGMTNLFSYDVGTKAVKQLTHHDDFDVMNASADADAIVYEQAGYVHLFDVKTGQAGRLVIDVVGDFPWARPQFKRVAADDSRRRAVADRSTRRVRGTRRHLHRAHRQGRLAQPHADVVRARAQSGVVARTARSSRGCPTRAASTSS